jgi:hypothetical protein
MLVSLAVLALALSVVGVVFTVTTRTASQSAAYSETHNWVRQWMTQIEEDLKYCEPSSSILVLVGRTQPAALTQSDLDAGKFYRVLTGNPRLVPAGYDPEYAAGLDNADPALAQYSNPRADIMMFFSTRPTASQAPPLNALPTDPYAGGVRFSPIRVVYGHAALGDPVWNGSKEKYEFPADAALRHIEQTVSVGGRVLSRLPANRWHLARVATIIVDPKSASVPTDVQFSPTACQQIARCEPYADGSWTMPGDAALLNLGLLLETFGPHYFGAAIPPLMSPYVFPTGWQTVNASTVRSLLYATQTSPPTNHHVATVLEQVPVDLKSNLGVHMLPGCAWFQVEFLMPEDPRNSAEYSSPDPTNPNLSQRADMPRWTAVEEGATYVFVPDTQENRSAVARDPTTGQPAPRLWTFGRLDQTPGNDPNVDPVGNRIIRMWPYAIRVTVRVYDPHGRLTEPIIRSVVHRFE